MKDRALFHTMFYQFSLFYTDTMNQIAQQQQTAQQQQQQMLLSQMQFQQQQSQMFAALIEKLMK